MKWIFTFTLACITTTLLGQQECDGIRYNQPAIATITITDSVRYGANVQPTLLNPNNIQQLYLDVYTPQPDTVQQRPLIIWAFGGGFVTGSRTNPSMTTLSTRFSQMGYVCASIDYRLTPELAFFGNDTLAKYAVVKAMHDMRAAIRFFWKSARNGNPYHIDTNRIFIGGVSAGAVTSLHTAYLNTMAEWPAAVDSTGLGGLAGNSGNAGYPSKIAGVINLAGGIGDTAWVDPNEAPLVSMHGNKDNVVPYGTDTVTLFNMGLLLHGSASLQEQANRIGLQAELYTFFGAGHVPFASNTNGPYMDTTIQFIKNFLYPLVCNSVLSAHQNIKPDKSLLSNIYPNPASTNITIAGKGRALLQLYNAMGHVVHREEANLPAQIHRQNWPDGWYLLSIRQGDSAQQLPVIWR